MALIECDDRKIQVGIDLDEIRNDSEGYIEFNTAVKKEEFSGWLNIYCPNNIFFRRIGKKIEFKTELLNIYFEGVGIEGSCPAEKDNDGCYFGNKLKKSEIITANKEFCNCEFTWKTENGAHGKSIGKTLPAAPTEIKRIYPKEKFMVENFLKIPCEQVLGAYVVKFERLM